MARSCALAALGLLALNPCPPRAQAPAKITIVVFGFPSLGAFMPPVIKAKKLDAAHGLDIEFVERPPDAYTTQFNSGEFKVGGSAAVLTVGLADARGVKVKYLFNLFDFWGAVVTSRPEVKTVKDLEGKQLAAAASTTNFVMFEFFAKKLGVDTVEGAGGQHRAARPRRLRARRPRRRHPALGAGLYAAEGEKARHPRRSTRASTRPGRASPAASASPISASPRIATGSSRTRR